MNFNRKEKKYVLDIRNVHKDIQEGHLCWHGSDTAGNRIDFTNYYPRWNGKPWLPVMGEFHYSRYPHDEWETELRKMKACGINIVATYIIWIHHEEDEGEFDWSGNRNLRDFVELCASLDLLCWSRIGPFCHGEVRNGGIPDWLYGRPFPLRCNDERYLFYVERLYREIHNQLTGTYFKDGGPVMGVQLENEFMQSGAPWETTREHGCEWVSVGDDGNEHMSTLKQLARNIGIDVPVYGCTTWGSPVPEGEFMPMRGGGYAFYAWEEDAENEAPKGNFLFCDWHVPGNQPYDETQVPYVGCETGGGMQSFYQNRPIVPGVSTEALSVITLAGGCNLHGYYMFHGGSNPVGKHSFMNEYRLPRISYDFQAPLREFGQLDDSYRRLKRLHLFINSFDEYLAPMAVALPDNNGSNMKPTDTETLRYAARTNDDCGFIFLNNYQDHVEMHDQHNVRLHIETKDKTIDLPYGRGLTLRKDVCAVLPFNLKLSDILLQSAVAQLITSLEVNQETWYFFFEPEGMNAQYVFVISTLESLELNGNGTQRQTDGLIVVEPRSGLDSVIRIVAKTGKSVNICTLTHEQSLNFWKGELQGRERVLICEAAVIFNKDGLELRQEGLEEFEWLTFPAVANLADFDSPASIHTDHQGIFQRQHCSVKTWEGKVDVETSRRMGTGTVWTGTAFVAEERQDVLPDQAVVHLDAASLDGLSDLRLEIDYEGDIGEAYIDGKLIHDNFNNGTPWVIGLKRFIRQLDGNDLYLRAIPRPSTEKEVGFTEMAAIQAKQPAGTTHLSDIRIVPEYKMNLVVN